MRARTVLLSVTALAAAGTVAAGSAAGASQPADGLTCDITYNGPIVAMMCGYHGTTRGTVYVHAGAEPEVVAVRDMARDGKAVYAFVHRVSDGKFLKVVRGTSYNETAKQVSIREGTEYTLEMRLGDNIWSYDVAYGKA